MRTMRIPAVLAALALAGCQSPRAELSGLASGGALDYSVFVTGGAFLTGSDGDRDTFRDTGKDTEVVTLAELADVLRTGAVFQRVGFERDDERRRALLNGLRAANADPALLDSLQRVRDQGYDLLLVVEQVQNGSIEAQGVNGRWPVTLATWLLLAVGMFIPDHTFESRATLRVTLRELQTGRVLHDPPLFAGPVDLSLVERSDFLGILESIVVPPFWVGDDEENVREAVGSTTLRRLLVSLARDLKSEPVRQRLRTGAGAAISALPGRRIRIEAAESLASVRLRPAAGTVDETATQAFERDLLATLRRDGDRFVYEALLPQALPAGRVQVLVSTITGGVVSATLAVEAGS